MSPIVSASQRRSMVVTADSGMVMDVGVGRASRAVVALGCSAIVSQPGPFLTASRHSFATLHSSVQLQLGREDRSGRVAQGDRKAG